MTSPVPRLKLYSTATHDGIADIQSPIVCQHRKPALRFTSNASQILPSQSFHSSIMVQAKYREGQTVEYKPVGGMPARQRNESRG